MAHDARIAHDAREQFRRQLTEWVSSQETLRSGDGSWAKAQRSMLRNLREWLSKNQ